MRKTVLCVLIVALLATILAGCECKHEWVDATCIDARTCVKCDTTEGTPLGHSWLDASCNAAKACTRCGVVEGTALGHSWVVATCEVAKYCDNCGQTEGEPMGHKWEEATCTTPLVCTVCAKVAGEALGHTWKDATCVEPATCYTCGDTSGEALGHKVTEWKETVASTCTEKGTEAGVCSVCSETVEQELPMKEHTAGEWEVTVEPTENSDGTRTKKCIGCGKELESESFTLSAEELEARYKNKCKTISYTELARSPGDYEGEYIKFSGRVVQVCSEAKSSLYYSTYRVAIGGSYSNVMYIYVDNYGSGQRILEDDWITFYGKFDGLYTYTTVMGASVTIPSVKVAYVN